VPALIGVLQAEKVIKIVTGIVGEFNAFFSGYYTNNTLFYIIFYSILPLLSPS
jgi:hypothetical protein